METRRKSIYKKHDNYLFDHGAHYLSTNHSVNQLNEVISRYNLGQVIEIDFATDYLKNKKTRKTRRKTRKTRRKSKRKSRKTKRKTKRR